MSVTAQARMAAVTTSAVTTPAAATAEPLIACENLVRIYQTADVEVQALQGLDLHVAAGTMVAIVGASGSGKSTLLGILSGLDAPTAGAARVGSWDLVSMSASDRLAYRRLSVGFVWQQTARNLVPYLSAQQNVELPMGLNGARSRVRADRARDLLESLGLADKAGRRPGEFSGGEQQRVAIGVALANEPSVVFADEPTGELDTATGDEVFAAFRRVNAELGTTVVIVTHDAAVSDQVQRTVAIRDGRTSSEVLRSTSVDEFGEAQVTAREFAVLDRAGRLQLPAGYRQALGLEKRVRLELESDHVGVWPEDDGAQAGGER